MIYWYIPWYIPSFQCIYHDIYHIQPIATASYRRALHNRVSFVLMHTSQAGPLHCLSRCCPSPRRPRAAGPLPRSPRRRRRQLPVHAGVALLGMLHVVRVDQPSANWLAACRNPSQAPGYCCTAQSASSSSSVAWLTCFTWSTFLLVRLEEGFYCQETC